MAEGAHFQESPGHRRCPFHRCREGKGHLLKSDALKSPRIWKGHEHLSENSVYVTALFLSPRTASRTHTHWTNQTTEMYGPTVPEAGRPRWGKQGHPPSEGAREGSVPGLSSSFPSFTCSPWPPLTCRRLTPPLPSASRGHLPLWAPVSISKLTTPSPWKDGLV